MGSGVTIKFDATKVEAKFKRFGQRARDLDNSLITALLLEFVEDVFDSQGVAGADGKWDAFQPSTLKRHPNRAGEQLLFNTGVLANFQSATKGDTSIVSSPPRYAKYFATGTKHMAKRNPFAVKKKKFMQEAETIIVLEIAR